MSSEEHRAPTGDVEFLGPGFELQATPQERVFGSDVLRIFHPMEEDQWILSDAPVEVER